jgi:hypothetical protein
LVADENAKLLEVARFPVAKVTFLNSYTSGNPPAEFRLVYEPDVDVKETLLKFVLDPVHDFASQSAILATMNELMRGDVRRLLLSHGRRPPFPGVPGDPLTPLLDSLAVF